MGLNYSSFYLAALFFYFSDALQKTTSSGAITWKYLFIRSCYTAAIALLFNTILFGLNTIPSINIILLMACCSVCCGLGLFFYIKSINTLKFSNVGSLTIVGNVIQQLIGIFLLGEKYNKYNFIAYALMSFGCVYQLINGKTLKGAKYVLLSSIFWTVGYIMLSRVLQKSTIYWSVPIMEITIMIMGYLCMKFYSIANTKAAIDKQAITIRPIFFILIALLNYFGSLLNNHSFKNIPISTISFLQLSLMPLFYIVSLKIFKEKPNKVELISFITGFAGFAIFIINNIKFASSS